MTKTTSKTMDQLRRPTLSTPGLEPLTPAEIEELRRDKQRISAYARIAFADFAPAADPQIATDSKRR